MSDHDLKQSDLLDELTAYMDGELDAESVRRVEERLARDPQFAQELRRMEWAWDMLDGLPRSMVDESFTNTTLEMVAQNASLEAEAVLDAQPRIRRRRRWLGIGAAAAAAILGFMLAHWLTPNPNRQLLEDLPLLQDFELYYQADNVDFLHQLDREGLFAEGDSDHAG